MRPLGQQPNFPQVGKGGAMRVSARSVVAAGLICVVAGALIANCHGSAPEELDVPDRGRPTALAVENALPGSDGWRITAAAGPGQLEGYASATSVQHGESVAVHVRA